MFFLSETKMVVAHMSQLSFGLMISTWSILLCLILKSIDKLGKVEVYFPVGTEVSNEPSLSFYCDLLLLLLYWW